MSNNTELAQTAVRIRESYGTLIARHFSTAADIDNKWIFSEDVSLNIINILTLSLLQYYAYRFWG